jgi:hypothetical protein
MKSFLRVTLILVIGLLTIQVIKIAIIRLGVVHSFEWGTILTAIQFYALMGVPLFFLFLGLLGRVAAKKFQKKSAFLATVIVFLLAEMTFTHWLNHPQRIPAFMVRAYRLYYDLYDYRIVQFQQEHAVHDPMLFYRLKPNSRFEFYNREFRDSFIVNSQGFRDDESSLRTPSIICLGDSYFMGWGVKQDETVAQQLEKISGMKTLNAAISSYGTVREMRLLNQLSLDSLKFLVIQYCPNDWEENIFFVKNNYELPVSSRQTLESLQKQYASKRVYFPGKYFALITILSLKLQLNKIHNLFPFGENTDKSGNVPASEKAAVFLDIMKRGMPASTRPEIIITYVGDYEDLDNEFLDNVSSIATTDRFKNKNNQQVRTINLKQLLSKDDYFLLDRHLRSSGHKKIANAIWSVIKE